MSDLACVFAEDERDSRAAGLSFCLADSLKSPLTPEKLKVFLVLDLAGHCGRLDFLPSSPFLPTGRERKTA
jgi:hypothetical protein